MIRCDYCNELGSNDAGAVTQLDSGSRLHDGCLEYLQELADLPGEEDFDRLSEAADANR